MDPMDQIKWVTRESRPSTAKPVLSQRPILEDLNPTVTANTKQMDSDEDEGFFGTPFPPLEEEQLVKRKPELDLTVRDSQGRRRFHGAFTGGFSAGHYMTVGSEEGFTPQQYKSNRQQRWDQSLIQRKPENFMDSEDLDVFGIAPKKITTKDEFIEQEFAGFRKTDSLIDVLKSVIKPTIESIGRKLYKRMKLNARNDQTVNEKVYSCEAIADRTVRNDLASYEPKSDLHGIGYKSFAGENESSNSKASNAVSAVFKSGRKINISGEAFGYGVLDEDIEDDAIVYHKDDMTQYDFEIGSLKDDSNKKKRDKRKEFDILRGDVIEGFTKGSIKINLFENIRNKYPTPNVPKGWRKSSSTAPKQRRSRWDQSSDKYSVKSNEVDSECILKPKAPVLNANVRAVLLGEEVVHKQGIKKTESEEKTKEQISSNASIQSISTEEKPKQKFKELVERPLTGFWANKFTRSSDGVEQSTLSGGLTEFKPKQSENVTENEANKSLEEKNRSVERTTYEWHPHNILCRRFNLPNPYPQYPDFVGVVTVGKSDVRNRTSKVNDKKAKPNIFECLLSDQVLSNSANDAKALTSNANEVISDANVSSDKIIEQKNENSKNIGPEKFNEKDNKENESNRPPMDLFKAIFASDEESDGENSEDEQRTNVSKSEATDDSRHNSNNDLESNVDSNAVKNSENCVKKSGVFANIDFDQLNRDFNPIIESKESHDSTNDKNSSEKNVPKTKDVITTEEPSADYYGPALPPDLSLYASGVSLSSVSIETKSKSTKRKKKEKKHKKHKKHKTDHKKHKRRHRSSSESDSSESIDIEQEILIKLKSTPNK